MAFNIASVSVRLLAETGRFVRDMQNAEGRLRAFGRTARRIGKIGLIGIAAGLIQAARGTKNYALALQDLSRQTGKSIEDLDVLAFVGKQARIPLEVMGATMRRVQRRASEAARGSVTLAKGFAELGIDARKFVGLGAVDQFRVLAEVLRDNGEAAEIFSQRFQLLDQDGQRLVQALQLPREELEELIAEARRTAAPIAKIAEEAEQLDRKMNSLARTGVAKVTGGLSDMAIQLGAASIGQRGLNKELNAEQLLQKVAISQEEKLALLRKKGADRGTGRQINRRLEFLNVSRGRPQGDRPRDPQLKETNKILRSILNQFRNNATGNIVTFEG